MASELPNCSSSLTGIDELDELDATEIDESLLRDLLEEVLQKDEEIKNDQTSCSTCAVQPTEATAIETVYPAMLGCGEFSEQIIGSQVHDSLWLDIMEMDPPSPMMNDMMMMWYGESCVEEEMGGGMVDFVGNGSDESRLYHHGAFSLHDDETTYGFLWQHDNLGTALQSNHYMDPTAQLGRHLLKGTYPVGNCTPDLEEYSQNLDIHPNHWDNLGGCWLMMLD